MAQVPKNQRLWDLVVALAKRKFRVYPSPAAAHWVHSEYETRGGQFTGSEKDVDPRQSRQFDNKKTADRD